MTAFLLTAEAVIPTALMRLMGLIALPWVSMNLTRTFVLSFVGMDSSYLPKLAMTEFLMILKAATKLVMEFTQDIYALRVTL